jgi:hypothetical protein
MEYKVICINASNRPTEVPVGSWIEKDETYTVIGASNMARQRMTLGYKLEEVEFPDDCEYQYYSASRFRPVTEDDMAAEAALEELLSEQLELVEI